jgi:hypothetical protein
MHEHEEPHGDGRSAVDLAVQIRTRLDDPPDDEDRLKAQVRRIVHEWVAGLDQVEIEDLFDNLRSRFPDRTYENRARAQSAEDQLGRLGLKVEELQQTNDRLQVELVACRGLIGGLRTAIADAISVDAPPASFETADVEGVSAMIDMVRRLLRTVLEMENAMVAVESGFIQSKGTPGSPLSELVGQSLDPGQASPDMDEIEHRLRRIGRLSSALLAGTHQSWTAGTREMVEFLDPERYPGKPILKSVPVPQLREARKRFESVWNQFDHTIAHYYRRRFEQIYWEKMEEGT